MKKHHILLFITLLYSTTSTAAIISFGNGQFIMSGSTYVNADGLTTEGIANVTEIRRADGSLFWENSEQDLNIVFKDFERNDVEPGIADTVQFSSVGGVVEFYTNASNTFAPTGNFAADSALLSGGEFQLGAVGAKDEFGNTAVGQFTNDTYSSNGYLSAIEGPWAEFFDTNVLGFADMTFNVSGNTVSTAGYDFAGSGDLATEVSQVPLPAAVWLFVPAVMGLSRFKKARS